MSVKIPLPDESEMSCSSVNILREAAMNEHLSPHIKVEPSEPFNAMGPLDLKGTNDSKKSLKNAYLNSVHSAIPKTEENMRRQFEMMTKDLQSSQHLCFTCGGKFSRKDHLVRHYSIHKGTRYNCSVCNKSFSRKDHVKRHMALHSGEGHPCNICDRVFAEKHRLRKHQMTHATIKL